MVIHCACGQMNEGRRHQTRAATALFSTSDLRLIRMRFLRIIFLTLEKPIGRTRAKLEEILPANFEPRIYSL
jgi:hypothetical protein